MATWVTNAAGAVSGKYTYDAYGNTLSQTGGAAGLNPYRFSTKEAVGSLVYYGYRFYSPSLGKWLNRDPIKEDGDVNIYSFASNSPVTTGDDWGMAPKILKDLSDKTKKWYQDNYTRPGLLLLGKNCKFSYLPETGWTVNDKHFLTASPGVTPADAVAVTGLWVKIPNDTWFYILCDPCGRPYKFTYGAINTGSILGKKPEKVKYGDTAFPRPPRFIGPPYQIKNPRREQRGISRRV